MGIQVDIYMLQCSKIELSVQFDAVIRDYIIAYIEEEKKEEEHTAVSPGWLGSNNTDLPQIQKCQLRLLKLSMSTTPF